MEGIAVKREHYLFGVAASGSYTNKVFCSEADCILAAIREKCQGHDKEKPMVSHSAWLGNA